MYIEKDLIAYNLDVKNQNELFDFMSDILEEKQYVNKQFREEIKKREEKYPTGLKLKNINIAIAHTEKEFSLANKLVVIKLKDTIPFKNIENLEKIDVSLVFGIVLADSDNHLEVLQKISQIFQDNQFIANVKNTKSQTELFKIMEEKFN